MPKKNQQSKNKAENQTFDVRENLNHAVNSITTENQNQSHNAKKEALGPNTKR